jgi:molybdate transport system substrate-binding protein
VLAGASAFGTAHAAAVELTVSAASSLSTALREIAAAFEPTQPGTRVLVNAAASDALLAQIARGAPVDVFISADQLVMDRAAGQGLLQAKTRRDVIGNSMVLITRADSKLTLRNAADLRLPAVTRIAIGQPTGVPAGRYAIGALETAGLWPALAPKAIYAQNVRQALDYVARGEVDAGFVYVSDAQLLADRVRVAFTLPTMVPVRYPAAVIASSRHPAAARRFVEHLLQPPAQAVFARHGFTPL